MIFQGDACTQMIAHGDSGEALDERSVFQFASLTKAFTALAVLQLAAEGKLRLDTPVRAYLPWFDVADSAAGAPITIRELLDHRSGIPTSAGLDQLFADPRADAGALDANVRRFARFGRHHGPVDFAYSNANYDTLGLVVTAVTHDTYEHQIEKRILEPLHLSPWFSWAPPRHANLARRFTLIAGMPVEISGMAPDRGDAPAAGLFGNIVDETRWLQALLDRPGSLLRDGLEHDRNAYGLGWYRVTRAGATYLWEPSWGLGSLAVAVLVPERHAGAIVFFDAAGFGQFFREPKIAAGLAEIMLSRTSPAVPGPDRSEYEERIVLPILLIGQIVGEFILTRRLRRQIALCACALLNGVAALVIPLWIIFGGGSISAGFRFSPLPTLILLCCAVCAGSAAVIQSVKFVKARRPELAE